jgi:hypothetical protein
MKRQPMVRRGKIAEGGRVLEEFDRCRQLDCAKKATS